MTVKAIMTFEDAPLERMSNTQTLVNETYAVPFVGGRNLCLNIKNLFSQYQGNPLLMLEDDVTVCNDFNHKVEKIIEQKPDAVINFFYPLPDRYKGLHKMEGIHYAYNQCVYFPAWFLDAYLDNYEKLTKECNSDYKRNKSTSVFDHLIRIYGRAFYAYFPYLVKCNNYRSTLGHDNPWIQNRDFIDDNQG